jgi:hypothetical protein
MTILNHPEMSVNDLIDASMYYEVNKKRIKQERLAKNCYQYINQYIDHELKGKAQLQPKDGFFYKNLNYQQNIEFHNATPKDKEKFIDWVIMFSCKKVKLVNKQNKKFCRFSDTSLRIIYK